MPSGAQPRRSRGSRSVAGSSRTTITGEPSSRGSAPSGKAVTNAVEETSSARSGRPSSPTSRRPRRHGVSTIESPTAGPSEVIGAATAAASVVPAAAPAAPSSRRRDTPSRVLRRRSSTGGCASGWASPGRASTACSRGTSALAATASAAPNRPRASASEMPRSWVFAPLNSTTTNATDAIAEPSSSATTIPSARGRAPTSRWNGRAAARPPFPGTLVARPVLPAAVLLRGILTCAFFGVDAFVALTLVGWRGVSATEAGIALTAATIAWTGGAWIQARGAGRWPTDRFVQAVFGVVLVGLAAMLLALDPDVTWLVAVPAFGIAGLGMGLAYSPLALIVLRESAVATQGASTSALSLTDSVGTALGTGITGAIVAASVRANGEPAAGLAVGFAVAIAIGIVGLSLTRRLRPRTVAATSLAFPAASPPP